MYFWYLYASHFRVYYGVFHAHCGSSYTSAFYACLVLSSVELGRGESLICKVRVYDVTHCYNPGKKCLHYYPSHSAQSANEKHDDIYGV